MLFVLLVHGANEYRQSPTQLTCPRGTVLRVWRHQLWGHTLAGLCAQLSHEGQVRRRTGGSYQVWIMSWHLRLEMMERYERNRWRWNYSNPNMGLSTVEVSGMTWPNFGWENSTASNDDFPPICPRKSKRVLQLSKLIMVLDVHLTLNDVCLFGFSYWK